MCFDFLYTFCLKKFFIMSWMQQDIMINVCRSSHKEPLILIRSQSNLEFKKVPRPQISWKSVQWEWSCSMWRDMRKLIVTFCNFANAPKSGKFLCYGTVPGQLWVAQIQMGGQSPAVRGVVSLITKTPGLSPHSRVQLLSQTLFLNLNQENHGR
jgi:hypothetical protein